MFRILKAIKTGVKRRMSKQLLNSLYSFPESGGLKKTMEIPKEAKAIKSRPHKGTMTAA